MLAKGDLIGIICCSDGRKKEDEKDLKRLKQVLEKEFGLQVVFAKTIFQIDDS
ncbi:LD-carboxypeptidase, partial [Listeria monocytogenes]|nr:LD-carboxypeptidase [Listeria monocytogenes]